ncbi:MAG TPA: dihydrodipicolinate reductase C-terminal domain-containing protein [Gemmatimonadales bacterium]|nr:dihydrodipicolinate reductase C-terminal domain-containing protein [Gemmatimonadales bacterium]
MRLALLGYGRMARVVEAQARDAGHEVGAVVTSRNAGDAGRLLPGHDVAIDFSVPGGVPAHVEACAAAGVPLIEGTTGWHAQEAAVRRLIEDRGGALVYGANFSIGANLFCRIVARAAELFRGVPGYDPFIEEAHHAAKRDAPSGTALMLKDILVRQLGRSDVSVASTRAGSIPGTHRVGFDSTGDQIMLTHAARSRDGCAAGALLAARWVLGRRGVYTFANVLDDVLSGEREAV